MLKWAAWNVALFELSLGVVALVALPVAIRGMLRRAAPPDCSVDRSGSCLPEPQPGRVGGAALGEPVRAAAPPRAEPLLRDAAGPDLRRALALARARTARAGSRRDAQLPRWRSQLSYPRGSSSTAYNTDVPSASFFIALDARIPPIHFRVWVILIAVVGRRDVSDRETSALPDPDACTRLRGRHQPGGLQGRPDRRPGSSPFLGGSRTPSRQERRTLSTSAARTSSAPNQQLSKTA